MRPLSRDKAPAVAVIGLLALSFVILAVALPPAHAGPPPTVGHTATGTWPSVGSTYTITLTVGFVGDAIAVMGAAGGLVQGTNPVISEVSSPSVNGGGLVATDFVLGQAQTLQCIGASFFCGGAGGQETEVESYWYATATAAGSITITVHLSASSNLVSEAQAYDIEYSNTTPDAVASTHCDATKTGDCGNPAVGGLTSGAGAVLLVGIANYGTAFVSASGGCTFIDSTNHGIVGSYFIGAATCGVNFNGNTGFQSGYATVAATYSASVVTSTTVINTACLGACSGGNNGTSIYLPPPTSTFFNLHFYASQNLAAAAQIDNVTLKVAAVHITTSTGTLYVLVYGATGQPTGGNPYVLLTQVPVSVSNGSSAFFIHTNPQTNLGSSQFYAVGIMTTTTASRGSGASGSGISVYETSQSGIVEYKFAAGSSTPPNSFFSSTVQTPRDFIYVHSTFTVATVTTTSTTTQSGLVTSTTTVTTTSTNVINQLNMTSAGFWFIPLLFLLAPMALLIVVKRVADGR